MAVCSGMVHCKAAVSCISDATAARSGRLSIRRHTLRSQPPAHFSPFFAQAATQDVHSISPLVLHRHEG
jgi:hypothetical protein